jgi:hypothetical protein
VPDALVLATCYVDHLMTARQSVILNFQLGPNNSIEDILSNQSVEYLIYLLTQAAASATLRALPFDDMRMEWEGRIFAK